jgi:serine phosphatase RsbU (regulator of sigma subunit)
MIKLPKIHIGKLSLLLAILVWLALLFVDLVKLFAQINGLDQSITSEFSWVLQILFFLMVYGFYKYSIAKNIQNDFLSLIWRGASTSIFAVSVVTLIKVFYSLLGDSRLANEPFLISFFQHVSFALIIIFLISTAILWQHLILYQKNKRVVKQWQAYEIAMLIGMFYTFINEGELGAGYLFMLVLLCGLALILSGNLKWIPYLTFKEKWKSLLFLAVIIIFGTYLFWSESFITSEGGLTNNLFIITLYFFIISYALFSFLVTLFNLPTSSVFEQKLTEAINFQRLSQSIQPGENEDQVLDILLDSCMSAAYADAAWLEMNSEEYPENFTMERFATHQTILELSKLIETQKVTHDWSGKGKPEEIQPLIIRVDHPNFESILLIPLVINKQLIGRMVLCKEVRDGFNKEMVNIISTFVRQACISVENHRLLNQAIENERYREELKIAKNVQKSLLPTQLDHNEQFEIVAYSNAADEVGGDYYDTYKIDEHHYVLIIGDVSGKGTSAAFNMSQMKGIFQSLIQLDLSPSEFMIKANAALGRCLERNHFITASIFYINTSENTVCHARAGHVPTLFYTSKDDKSTYLEIDGLGLGILRNKQYEMHVEEKTFSYSPDDVLVLYTDGIIEAKDEESNQFGFERLRSLLEINNELSPSQLQSKIIDSLHSFVGGDGMVDDDYSLMVVKFIHSGKKD